MLCAADFCWVSWGPMMWPSFSGGCFWGFSPGWVLSSLGWKQLGYSATVAGLSLVYFTIPIGIIVGVIVCYKLSSTRLRQQSARPNTDSGSDYPKNQELTLRMRLKP